MTGRDSLERRVSELEETVYSDDSPEELYMKSLKHLSTETDEEHPGAAEEFHRRFIQHKIEKAARQAHRAERFGDSP